MFILGNLLSAIAQILDVVLTMIFWLVLIRALLSWVNPDPGNPIVMFLYRVTEPMLAPFRRLIPMQNLGIDLSPLILVLAIMFCRHFVIRTLFDIAARLQ